jgi:hypothetical protein
MNKPIISPMFTIDDIHKIREFNYEMSKNLSEKDRLNYYNEKGKNAQLIIEKIRADKNKANSSIH